MAVAAFALIWSAQTGVFTRVMKPLIAASRPVIASQNMVLGVVVVLFPVVGALEIAALLGAEPETGTGSVWQAFPLCTQDYLNNTPLCVLRLSDD